MYGLETLKFSEIVTVSLTLFAVIDILGSIPILIGIKQKMGDIHAGMATLVSGVLMLAFFFFGSELLGFMGLDVPSFAIAGSIIIFFLAMEMVLGIEFFKSDGNSNAKSGSIVPIAFPMIAGSGTLTTVMSLQATYSAYNILIGILVNLIIVFFLSAFTRIFGAIIGAIRNNCRTKVFRCNIGGDCN